MVSLGQISILSMTIQKRINAFAALGTFIGSLKGEELETILRKVENNNNWFTPVYTKQALQALCQFLDEETLEKWVEPYDFNAPVKPKAIGLMLAGNLPAVGFHDVLCVLIAGHQAHIKLSSSDKILLPFLLDKLIDIEPEFRHLIIIEEMLKAKDAYIATGSDNSARYFNYYFGKYPHIIRNNRTSVAIMKGDENQLSVEKLGKDIFQYYGLGCRNVSKIFVPNQQTLLQLLDGLEIYKYVADHHKYTNNYDYNKSIYLVNKEPHYDNGFLLLRESAELVSPISVMFYELYDNPDTVREKLKERQEKIQCVVSDGGWFEGSIDFGQAQCPTLWDYADGIDTLKFLKELN
jgi:hypothetical protein